MKQSMTWSVSVVFSTKSRKPRLLEREKSDYELHYLSAISKSEFKLALNREDAQLSSDYSSSDRM